MSKNGQNGQNGQEESKEALRQALRGSHAKTRFSRFSRLPLFSVLPRLILETQRFLSVSPENTLKHAFPTLLTTPFSVLSCQEPLAGLFLEKLKSVFSFLNNAEETLFRCFSAFRDETVGQAGLIVKPRVTLYLRNSIKLIM